MSTHYSRNGSNAAAGDHRRKWDVNEYSARANERKAKERDDYDEKNSKDKMKGPKIRRELLHYREEKVQF